MGTAITKTFSCRARIDDFHCLSVSDHSRSKCMLSTSYTGHLLRVDHSAIVVVIRPRRYHYPFVFRADQGGRYLQVGCVISLAGLNMNVTPPDIPPQNMNEEVKGR